MIEIPRDAEPLKKSVSYKEAEKIITETGKLVLLLMKAPMNTYDQRIAKARGLRLFDFEKDQEQATALLDSDLIVELESDVTGNQSLTHFQVYGELHAWKTKNLSANVNYIEPFRLPNNFLQWLPPELRETFVTATIASLYADIRKDYVREIGRREKRELKRWGRGIQEWFPELIHVLRKGKESEIERFCSLGTNHF